MSAIPAFCPVVAPLPKWTKIQSFATEAVCASTSVSNGSADRPSPPAVESLRTYQTRCCSAIVTVALSEAGVGRPSSVSV